MKGNHITMVQWCAENQEALVRWIRQWSVRFFLLGKPQMGYMRRQKREKQMLTNSKIKIPTNDWHNKEQRTERSS